MKALLRIVMLTLSAAALALMLAACTIHVDDKDKDAKKVDIQTPLANLKVDTSESSTDNGIPVYPGATPRPESNGDKHRANVNIGAMGFGLKVIAAEYDTPDSPEKVKAFYLEKLKKWGDVLECRGTSGDEDANVHLGKDDGDQKLTCGDSKGDGWELKVGTRNNQHLVAVKPEGSGTRFGTVLVQIHGKEGTL
ncbi:MAG TPA: hypothetical protein VIH91_01190 [Terriglobales bacterium]